MAPCGTDHPAWLTSSGTWSPSELACGQAAWTATATASGRNPASRTSSHDAAAASAQTARSMAASPILSLPSPRTGLASPRRDRQESTTSEDCGLAAPLEYDPLTGLLPVWPRGGAPASPSLDATVKTSRLAVSSMIETRRGAGALPEGGAHVLSSVMTHPRGMEGVLTPLSSRYDALERPMSSRDAALERPYSSRCAALEQSLQLETSEVPGLVRAVPQVAGATVAEGAFVAQNPQWGVSLLEDGTWDGTCVPPSGDVHVRSIEDADAPMLPGSRDHALERPDSSRGEALERPMSLRVAALEQPVPGQTPGLSDMVPTVPPVASVAVAEGTCGLQNSQWGVSLREDGACVPPSYPP